LDDLLAACAARGWQPFWNEYVFTAPRERWHCEVRKATRTGKRDGRLIGKGTGHTREEALERALRQVGGNRRKKSKESDCASAWDFQDQDYPTFKRADHYDNYAYSIWPVERRDDD
jgi:hypothetical protein